MTFDSPAPGVVIAQPARGFRYAADAMWLAGFAWATGPAPRTALDLGTGSGVVALLLAAQGAEVLGIDARAEWGPLWAETLRRSAAGARVALRRADVADGVDGRFDLITSNPPFFPAGSGPVSPDPFKAAARTESTAGLARFLEVALAARDEGGRACFVVPREREGALVGIAAPSRWVRVGRRRSLLCFGPGAAAAPEAIEEGAPALRAWVEAVAPGG